MEEKKLEVQFSSGVKYNGQYYLAAMHMNALFRYDECKSQLTFLTSFYKEKKKSCLYLKAFLYKNEAWFIPYHADYIAIVNLEKITIEYMPLLYSEEYGLTPLKYINITYIKNNHLLLVPQDVDAAMLINLEEKKAKAYYGIVVESMTYPYHAAVYMDEKVFFFPWRAKNILMLDLKTDERIYFPWSEEQESFGDVVFDDKTRKLFYAPAKENYILIEDIYKKSCKKIKVGDWVDREYRTYYATEGRKEIFFWGHEKNLILKMDKENCSVKKYHIDYNSLGIFFFPLCSDNVEALVFDGNCIIKYDEEKKSFYTIHIYITFFDFIQQLKKTKLSLFDIVDKDGRVFFENIDFWLQELILIICMKRGKQDGSEKINVGKTGNKIYKEI